MELSPRMADLTRERFQGTNNGDIAVLQENALSTTWPVNVDCIFAFYVLDIMSNDDIALLLRKARESLSPSTNAKVVLVSITMPSTGTMWRRFVMSTWQAIVSRFPILLGGCRPIHLPQYLSKEDWKVEECETISVLGYASEIVIATPVFHNEEVE